PVVGSPQTHDQPTRSAGASVRNTLNEFSQTFAPVAASTQTTFSPSVIVSGLCRHRTYSLPRITIGVLRVPSSALFQIRFSPSGDQLAGSPFSREMPFISGPRQWGQSSGSISWAAPVCDQAAARQKTPR